MLGKKIHTSGTVCVLYNTFLKPEELKLNYSWPIFIKMHHNELIPLHFTTIYHKYTFGFTVKNKNVITDTV